MGDQELQGIGMVNILIISHKSAVLSFVKNPHNLLWILVRIPAEILRNPGQVNSVADLLWISPLYIERDEIHRENPHVLPQMCAGTLRLYMHPKLSQHTSPHQKAERT